MLLITPCLNYHLARCPTEPNPYNWLLHTWPKTLVQEEWHNITSCRSPLNTWKLIHTDDRLTCTHLWWSNMTPYGGSLTTLKVLSAKSDRLVYVTVCKIESCWSQWVQLCMGLLHCTIIANSLKHCSFNMSLHYQVQHYGLSVGSIVITITLEQHCSCTSTTAWTPTHSLSLCVFHNCDLPILLEE